MGLIESSYVRPCINHWRLIGKKTTSFVDPSARLHIMKGEGTRFAVFEEVEETSPENTREILALQILTLSHLQSSAT